MPGLPLTTQRVVVMWQRWRTPVRCVFGAGNSLNAAAERGGSRGAPASRGHCLPFQTTVGRSFGWGRPGRRGRRPGGSRGAAAWSLGLWGTHPSMAENGPSRRCSTPFRCPGGRVWGEGGGCFFAGARACACGAREGWKRLVYLDASLSPSLVLVLLAKPYGPVPRIPPSLRTFRGSLRSRQEALGTASPPPGSPGARNGRAADSERAIQEERRACLQRLRQLTGSPHTHPGRPTSSRRPPLPARALRHSFGDARKRALSPTRRAAAPRRSARPGARAEMGPLAPT